MPTPLSRTRMSRPSSARATDRVTSPPSSRPDRPCFTAFSTRGWMMSGGMGQSRQSEDTSMATVMRSPNRACSMAR